jgi:photosystem II stability/assembly factor-like uncharacterized protein
VLGDETNESLKGLVEMVNAILGTTHGVYRLDGDRAERLGLERERVSAVYAYPDGKRILAGSYESGLFLSDDSGESWNEVTNGFTALCVRWLGDDKLNPGSILAGTEPGRIFRSGDRGESWSELEGIRDIEGHEDWFLPYSPRAGAVRNVYTPPGSARYLASVEVGGLLESTDGGKTWTCRHIGVDSDIHFITGHPNNGDVLYAALGYAGIERTSEESGQRKRGGVARSTDSGKTWTKLFGDYTRAVIVPPFKPEIVVAGPSPDVGRNGRIEVSRDGGDTWEDASSGIETPMPDMVEIMVSAPDNSIWSICSGGRLLRAHPEELHWTPVVPESARIEVEDVSYI